MHSKADKKAILVLVENKYGNDLFDPTLHCLNGTQLATVEKFQQH